MPDLYFAPLEGVTGYVYRAAHHKYFNHIDQYFTPFISPNQNGELSYREKMDVLPEHNQGMRLVPQILTNRADYFIRTARELYQYGYREVNLNLGCPSRTVVSKNKGSGFLADQEGLLRFFDEVFTELTDMEVSVKTRIGKDSSDEFDDLLGIFNRFPVKELIVHPRIQKDYYGNRPDMTVFAGAVRLSKNRICYNGDIFTRGDYETFTSAYPGVPSIMCGRGLIANPGLAGEIRGEKRMDRQTLKAFHDTLLDGYRETSSGDRNVLFKMKELWSYMGCLFPDGAKDIKKIRKSTRLNEYGEVVRILFAEREMSDGAGYMTGGEAE